MKNNETVKQKPEEANSILNLNSKKLYNRLSEFKDKNKLSEDDVKYLYERIQSWKRWHEMKWIMIILFFVVEFIYVTKFGDINVLGGGLLFIGFIMWLVERDKKERLIRKISLLISEVK